MPPPPRTAPQTRAHDTESPRLAAQIIELSRTLSLTTPPPRESPYFGLDDLEPLQVGLLAQLTAAGIFRKYEFALGLGSVLGGAARWLALSRGCRVVGITSTLGEAVAANLLTRRANLSAQVTALPAEPAHLPFPPDQFTHIWCVDALLRAADPLPICAAAFRAVRPGGLLFAQETIVAERDTAGLPREPAWRFRTLGDYVAALRHAGFVDIIAEDVTAMRHEATVTVQTARPLLVRRITETEGPGCAYLRSQQRLALIGDARRRGLLRTANLVATRPAVHLP
jgi:SAM-dependent methyltransferase